MSRFEWTDGIQWGFGGNHVWDAPDALGCVPPEGERDLRLEVAQRHAARAECMALVDLREPQLAREGFMDDRLRDLRCTRWIPVHKYLLPWHIEVDRRIEGWRYFVVSVHDAVLPPFIHAGDLVLVQRLPPTPRGTLVLALTSEGGSMIGRVVTSRSAGRRGLIELGGLDPRQPPVALPSMPSPVVGRVVGRWSRHPDRLPPWYPNTASALKGPPYRGC